ARQNDAPFSSTTKACFEKVDERQANLAQFNRLDKQSKKRSLRGRHYAWPDGELTTETQDGLFCLRLLCFLRQQNGGRTSRNARWCLNLDFSVQPLRPLCLGG